MARLPIVLKTPFPKESILAVDEGAPCFVGQATAFSLNDVSVIIIAQNMQDLAKAVKPYLKIGEPFRKEVVYKMVTMQYARATVDDEL